MNSIILRTAARFLEPVLLLFSLFLLLVGHNEPGGGFVGGLVAASAFCLHALAYDAARAKWLTGIDPHTLIGIGLLCAFGAGLAAFIVDAPFLTGLWTEIGEGPDALHLGTPLLFDVGVYLVVSGVTLLIVLTLMEE
jgi:multicomponent Na+:H+ antiporter subunit B